MKKHYKKPSGWEPIRDKAGNVTNVPPLSHIEVKHTGASPEQNFSTRLVEQGVALGFMTLGKGKITLHAKPEDLTYKIVRSPGHYCCHCGAWLTDAAMLLGSGLTNGAQHVVDEHPGVPSPDAGNPSGYERINHYETILDTEQHNRFRVGRK